MALGGPPRSHENELPPRLFSHQCMEGVFCELRLVDRVLGTSRLLRSLTFAAVAFVVDGHLSPIRQQQRHLSHHTSPKPQNALS
jgi:hypothetical protein